MRIDEGVRALPQLHHYNQPKEPDAQPVAAIAVVERFRKNSAEHGTPLPAGADAAPAATPTPCALKADGKGGPNVHAQFKKSDQATRSSLAICEAIAGSLNWKVAPWCGLRLAHSLPQCPSMIERLMESPMPVPSGFVVKNASNSRSESSPSSP